MVHAICPTVRPSPSGPTLRNFPNFITPMYPASTLANGVCESGDPTRSMIRSGGSPGDVRVRGVCRVASASRRSRRVDEAGFVPPTPEGKRKRQGADFRAFFVKRMKGLEPSTFCWQTVPQLKTLDADRREQAGNAAHPGSLLADRPRHCCGRVEDVWARIGPRPWSRAGALTSPGLLSVRRRAKPPSHGSRSGNAEPRRRISGPCAAAGGCSQVGPVSRRFKSCLPDRRAM